MTNALETEGLVKRYGATTALSGVDLAVPAGRILGLLGPNGAGKTTMIRILATLLRPDAGTARVGGLDVVRQAAAVRRLVGLTGQYASVDEDLTGAENLVLIGRLLDLPKATATSLAVRLLDRFGLDDAAGRQVRTYSGGMRRRLDLAASLIGEPEVIFLDEPTTGLDPGRREDLWAMIRSTADSGATVLLTTQYLEEADALADRIAVIDNGRVIATGTPAELKQVVGGQTIVVRPRHPDQLDRAAQVIGAATGRAPEPSERGVLSVAVDGDAAFGRVVAGLGQAGIGVTEISLRLPSLDEVFFTLTGRHTGSAGAGPGSAGAEAGHASPIKAADQSRADQSRAHPQHASRSRTHRQGVHMTGTTAPPTAVGSRGSQPLRLARHSLLLARRGLTKTRRNPGLLLDALFLPVVFLLLFVYLFGGAVTGSVHTYLQYVFPGVLVMTTLMTGLLASGVSLNIDVKTRVFDRFRSLPIGRSAPLIGSVTGDAVRYLVAVTALFGLGFLLGFRVHTGPLAALAACGLAITLGFSLSWVTVLVGLLVREPVVVQTIGFLGIFPLAFGTDMVAPTSTLPGWLQAWVKVNPVSDAIEACRGLLVGGPVASAAARTLVWSAGILAVFVPLAVATYRRRT